MNYVELWCNNDNNDNTHAGAKFDAGGGAETSFPLTVTLRLLKVIGNKYWLFPINFDKWGVNAYSSKRTNIRFSLLVVLITAEMSTKFWENLIIEECARTEGFVGF